MPKKYSYNRRCGNLVNCWRENCHIPAEFRQTAEQEAAFRKNINCEVSPLSLAVFCCWAWVPGASPQFWIWQPGTRWVCISGVPRAQIAQYIVPPIDAIGPELGGHGRGFGVYSDMIIEAADKLYAEADEA